MKLITEFFYSVRFALAGIVTTALYTALFFLLYYFTQLQPEIISLISYSSSIIFSYFLQSRFTFKVKNDAAKTIFLFLFVSVLGLAVSYWMMAILTHKFLMSPITVTLLMVIIIPIVNYISMRLVVFNP